MSLEKNRDEMTSGGQNKFLHWETERHLLMVPKWQFPSCGCPFILPRKAAVNVLGDNRWPSGAKIQISIDGSKPSCRPHHSCTICKKDIYNSISPTTAEYFKRHYLIHLLSFLWSKCPIFYFYFISGKISGREQLYASPQSESITRRTQDRTILSPLFSMRSTTNECVKDLSINKKCPMLLG